jgi:carboxypeptidase Taq
VTARSPRAERFFALWQAGRDLRVASSILEWDQETLMPPRGAAARGRVLATLAAARHERLTAPELRAALEDFAAEVAPDSDDAAQADRARHEIDRASRIPAELASAEAAAQSAALVSWQAARAARDFSLFAPDLRRLLAIVREKAAAWAGAQGRPYDALLDEFEPGTTEAALLPLFAGLRAELAPLIAQVAASGLVVDESAARGAFPPEAQRRFGEMAAAAIGFDFKAGRLDRAAHPFCSGFGPGDVRLTWRWQEDDFRPAFFGILHEAGHGLYEQGLPPAWEATPLGDAAGLGAHESQSRLWENAVGRTRGFWKWALRRWPEFFSAPAPELERLWPALHACRPSLIRVEADEATYNLHVIARFELERRLFSGALEVDELPAAWNAQYQDLLGIVPQHDGEGVLQDIHWAMGGFGYFPSYTLGNLMAAQLYAAAERDLGGGLETAFASGEFSPLHSWLHRHVHSHGRRRSSAELIRRATGADLSPAPLLSTLRARLHAIYTEQPSRGR